jgi:hypothetical protein
MRIDAVIVVVCTHTIYLMSKLLIYSANLAGFEHPHPNASQVLPEGIDFIEEFRFTDHNFPPRFNAMTPRLQARIVKMFPHQFKPDFDYYLWVDASHRLARADSARWFFEQIGDADIAVIKHPNRQTIQEEADYLKQRLFIEQTKAYKDRYVTIRYEGEDIDGALSAVDPQAPLYASTTFLMRNSPQTQEAMKEFWYITSRYHSVDQLGYTHALQNLSVSVINKKEPYVEYTR